MKELRQRRSGGELKYFISQNTKSIKDKSILKIIPNKPSQNHLAKDLNKIKKKLFRMRIKYQIIKNPLKKNKKELMNVHIKMHVNKHNAI